MSLNYFWIAEYNDKTALPQFDPDTGEEILFSKIDQTKLIKFSWYPFTLDLSSKVPGSVSNPLLPKLSISLEKDDKLIAKRRNYIQLQGKVERRFTEYLAGIEGRYLAKINEMDNIEIINGE